MPPVSYCISYLFNILKSFGTNAKKYSFYYLTRATWTWSQLILLDLDCHMNLTYNIFWNFKNIICLTLAKVQNLCRQNVIKSKDKNILKLKPKLTRTWVRGSILYQIRVEGSISNSVFRSQNRDVPTVLFSIQRDVSGNNGTGARSFVLSC